MLLHFSTLLHMLGESTPLLLTRYISIHSSKPLHMPGILSSKAGTQAVLLCHLLADICTLPMNVGLCLARIPRWWYNKEYKRCYRFNYGGCSGNNNNFQTEAVCRAICPDTCKSQGSRLPCSPAPVGDLGVGGPIPGSWQAWGK